jgi:Spy/CpxP family protein refolding chaperone
MLKKVILLVAIVALVAGTQAFAAEKAAEPKQTPAAAPSGDRPAGGGQGMRAGMGGPSIFGILRQLNLTPEQNTKVDELRKAGAEKMQAVGQAVMAAQMKVMELVNSGGSNADIMAAAAEYGKAFGEQMVQNAAMVKDIKAILTPEQKTKMEEIMKERAARGAGGGRNRGAGGEGQGQGPRGPRPEGPQN